MDRGVFMALLQLLGLHNTTPDERLDDSQHWSKGAITHTWHVKSGPEVCRLFALGNEEVAGGPATMRWWGCLKLVNGTRDAAVLLPPGSIHHSRWWDGYGIYKQELKVTFRVALFNLTTKETLWPTWGQSGTAQRPCVAAALRDRP